MRAPAGPTARLREAVRTRRFADDIGGLLEFACIAIVLGLVIGWSLPHAIAAAEHTMATEALMIGRGAIVELQEARALTGRWPDRDDWQPSGIRSGSNPTPGRYVLDLVASRDGAFHAELGTRVSARPGRLSVRAAMMPGVAGSPVVWLCGPAPAPPGFTALARNRTDAAAASLPSPCRAPPAAPQR
jgi:hypothetical protein